MRRSKKRPVDQFQREREHLKDFHRPTWPSTAADRSSGRAAAARRVVAASALDLPAIRSGYRAMIDLERIADLCERLGFSTMATHLPHIAGEAAHNQWSFIEFFERLAQAEHRERQERSRTLLTRTAGFPAIKTLEQYDCTFATGAPNHSSPSWQTLTFVERAENVVLLSSSDVIRPIWPLGCKATQSDIKTRFVSAVDLTNSHHRIGKGGSKSSYTKMRSISTISATDASEPYEESYRSLAYPSSTTRLFIRCSRADLKVAVNQQLSMVHEGRPISTLDPHAPCPEQLFRSQ
jgi:hypothetical protein